MHYAVNSGDSGTAAAIILLVAVLAAALAVAMVAMAMLGEAIAQNNESGGRADSALVAAVPPVSLLTCRVCPGSAQETLQKMQ